MGVCGCVRASVESPFKEEQATLKFVVGILMDLNILSLSVYFALWCACRQLLICDIQTLTVTICNRHLDAVSKIHSVKILSPTKPVEQSVLSKT